MNWTSTVKHWLTLPHRLARLITFGRLQRLWYYIKLNQTEIIVDRIMRIIALGKSEPMQLKIYSPEVSDRKLIFPVQNSPLVSILIPVYNQWKTTYACLISVFENSSEISYEIIIADDCSQDETQYLATIISGVTHLINNENLGFLRNCNNAAQEAKGKYLLFLNNDTQVQPGWLSSLVKAAEKDAQVGIVGSMLLYPDGRLQEAGGIMWSDASGWNYGRLDFPERPEYNYIKEVDYISGASILVRKSMWDEIGGFDERFAPAYYEDTDLAFEARRLGYKVIYQPLSRVVHLEGVSHGTSLISGVKSRQAVNQATFRNKWASVLDAEHGVGPQELYRARDRSRNKKRLLFIDHYVPLRDQDAGSRSTFQYLELMVEMGYQITFLGDNFVDYQPYTLELQQLGIEVLYGPGLQRRWKQWIITNAKNFDYVYISRPDIAKKYLPHIKRHTAAKVLYCGHDLHSLREERHFKLEGKHTYLQAAQKWEQSEKNILQQVDMAYFFSQFEVDEVHRRFAGSTVRAIPLYLFDDSKFNYLTNIGFQDREGLLFVGGFMHSPNVDAVCWFVNDVLPIIQECLPDVVFTVVGSNPNKEIMALSSSSVQITGRVSDDALNQYYDHTRLVVAPLRYGAGVKGKIIEAMHIGVPIVTTEIGAEGIGDADTALIISKVDASEFAKAVIATYNSPEKWLDRNFQSKKIIKRHFSKDLARSIFSQDMPL